MKNQLGKWQQNQLLQQNPLTAKYTPATCLYSLEDLLDFLNHYQYVYVKHDSAGQGRAIFKVYQNNDGRYCINGFTIQGKPIFKCMDVLEEFHQLLHPFAKFGRLSGPYIIQEGIQSITQNGQSFCLRVHTQSLKGTWVIGGIYGKIGTAEVLENGIVNSHRGAQVKTVDELLSVHLKLKAIDRMEVIDSIEKVSLSAAEVISTAYPRREYGMDFGISPNREPALFEVNTTPGIGGFAKIEEKALWKRIVEIRKWQSEG